MACRLLPNILFLAASVALSLFSLTAHAAPRVAIVDFENRAQYRTSWHLGQGAADILTTELVKINKFDVFERERMSSILTEQDFGQSGRVDPSTAAQIGRLIGVDFIVTGAITEFGTSDGGGGGGGVHIGKKGFFATVDIRIVDVQTGRIAFADSGEGSKKSMNIRVMGFGGGERNNTKNESAVMRLAMKDLAKKISKADLDKKLSSGTSSNSSTAVPTNPSDVLIAFIDGSDVTLNKGHRANVQQGATYDVKRPTGTIKDPTTGRVIKVKYKTLGKIKITAVDDTYSDAIIVSNKGMKVGDVVGVPKVKKKSSVAPVKTKAKPQEQQASQPSSSQGGALGFLASKMGKTTVNTNTGGNVDLDAWDDDALEDYFNGLKTSVKLLSSFGALTSEQYEQVNMAQAWSGIIVGQLETALIELDEWPADAKQEGWKVLGKRITKYNKLFNKHRKTALANENIPQNFRSSLESIELLTKENFLN